MGEGTVGGGRRDTAQQTTHGLSPSTVAGKRLHTHLADFRPLCFELLQELRPLIIPHFPHCPPTSMAGCIPLLRVCKLKHVLLLRGQLLLDALQVGGLFRKVLAGQPVFLLLPLLAARGGKDG